MKERLAELASKIISLESEARDKDERIAVLEQITQHHLVKAEARIAELEAELKEELCVKKYAIKRLTEMKLMNTVKLEKQMIIKKEEAFMPTTYTLTAETQEELSGDPSFNPLIF